MGLCEGGGHSVGLPNVGRSRRGPRPFTDRCPELLIAASELVRDASGHRDRRKPDAPCDLGDEGSTDPQPFGRVDLFDCAESFLDGHARNVAERTIHDKRNSADSIITGSGVRSSARCCKQPRMAKADPKASRLGAGIRRVRKARGLTLEQLADLVGTKHAPLSQYERGERNPSVPMLEQIAAALNVDPGAFWSDDDVPGESRSGLVKTVTLETVFARGEVTGADTLAKAPPGSPLADLRKALKLSHLHRSGEPDYRTIEIAGTPKGAILIDCRDPLEVRVEGVVKQLHPAGTVLVADPDRAPEPEDLVLTLFAPEPNEKDLEKSVSFAQVRRFERGPRGVPLLFALDKDEAVVLGGDWYLVATIVDFRYVRP